MENTLGGDRSDYVLAMDHFKLGNEELINNIIDKTLKSLTVFIFPAL